MQARQNRVVLVSNRVPELSDRGKWKAEGSKQTGGLVSALLPAVEETGGLWFGWSGEKVKHRASRNLKHWSSGNLDLVMIDLTDDEAEHYYSGFSNRTLWPLFHGFPALTLLNEDDYHSYLRVNRRFAAALFPLLKPGDHVWVQDYHLIPLGAELRRLGWSGRLGFFLHIPFPPPEIFAILPWAAQIITQLSCYHLIGFHTQRYHQNFIDAAMTDQGGSFDGRTYRHGNLIVQVGVYPIGIDHEPFRRWAGSSEGLNHGLRLRKTVDGRAIIIGVDRLDYTKGIPLRLRAFQRLLERFPSWHGRVCLVQISSPSRTDIPEYTEQKRQVDQLVGEINGRFSDQEWIPVRYLYRTFRQDELAGLYNEADVCLVTPLRDGMNLVCKEYIASQTSDPGVLVLSRFCGAADEMPDALIVNPYHIDGTARLLKRALEMSLRQRRARWKTLYKVVVNSTAQTWRKQFLSDLAATGSLEDS